jgi:YebC/PmpR family DNA-binding regulatory protein
MSGHSKWSQIKRQKQASDQKRGQAFTKLANAIIIAIKAGGGVSDPETNFKLRLVIDKAKSLNMPKENIERAIERAKGGAGGELEEVYYEGFAKGGVAILIEAATDNRQRTAQELKNIFDNFGGSLAGPGATSYLFKSMGMVSLAKEGKSADELMDKAIEAGAEDIEEVEEEVLVYSKPEDLHKIRQQLSSQNLIITLAELTFKPVSFVTISSEEASKKILTLLEKIEENEAVQKVFANFDIPDTIIKKIS